MPKTLDSAIAFFHEHGGYSYDATKETPEQGRTRCARMLARAESKALRPGIRFVWRDDPYADWSWLDQDTFADIRDDEHYAETCLMQRVCSCCHEWYTVEALGGIFDATPEHRRVIQAELAVEYFRRAR